MDNSSLLYKYFSNTLTDTEKQQLEEILQNDAEFKSEFEFQKNLKRVITKEENNVLKQKLKGFEEVISESSDIYISESEGESKVIKPKFNWKVAASVVLLISAGWFGFQNFSGPNYNTLYQDNYSAYPNTVYTITRGDTNESAERAAFVAYEKEDYKLALKTFKSLSPQTINHKFYMAQSYLALSEYTNAEALFTEIKNSNSDFKDEAQWFLALSYVKQEQTDKAIAALKTVVNTNAYKADQAKALLKELQ